MICLSIRRKRRAAWGAILALLSFAVCLGGERVADWMGEAALRPPLDLQPILQDLQTVQTDGAYSSAMQMTMGNRPDILAAAVVTEHGTILATYPDDPNVVGQSVLPAPPGRRFRVPGITAEQPTEDGWYLYLRPGDPANEGPVDPPWRAGSARPWIAFDDPQVERRFSGLILRNPVVGRPVLEGHLVVARLLRQFEGPAGALLLVLPRAHQRAFELATHYLRPALRIGAIALFALFCLMLPWWVYLDARPRTEKAAPLAVFVLLTNFLGWLTYLVIRPEAERLCLGCGMLMDPGHRCCPYCGWSSQARCGQCGRPARPDWRFCPYCEAPRGEIEVAARAAARREIEGRSG